MAGLVAARKVSDFGEELEGTLALRSQEASVDAERGHNGARQCLTTKKMLRKRQAYCWLGGGDFVGQGGRSGPPVTLGLHGGRDRESLERLPEPSLLQSRDRNSKDLRGPAGEATLSAVAEASFFSTAAIGFHSLDPQASRSSCCLPAFDRG